MIESLEIAMLRARGLTYDSIIYEWPDGYVETHMHDLTRPYYKPIEAIVHIVRGVGAKQGEPEVSK